MVERDKIDDRYGCIERTASDETGVRVYKQGKVEDGLILFHSIVDNKAVVIDHDGRKVEEFTRTPPGFDLYRPIRVGSRATILGILTSTTNRNNRVIAEINREGNFIRRTSQRWFTHDFHELPNGNWLSVVRENREFAGRRFSDTTIVQLNATGDIHWQWSLGDHIDELRDGAQVRRNIEEGLTDNPFHINSIAYTSWSSVSERFGEPVIVVSARNINSVFLLGRKSEKILYEMPPITLGQHHARLLPDIYPGKGNIIVFDNGISFAPGDQRRRNSRVLEFSVDREEIVWEYTADDFFSPIVGAQQRFTNGNTFITEGYYGRLFEVDYGGNIVWDYVYPEANSLDIHPKPLWEAGLRQIYRAYKVPRSHFEDFEVY